MIKSFENYTLKSSFGNGFSQWEKRYDDGLSTCLCVDGSNVTRALVRSAFEAQEDGQMFGSVFSKKDAQSMGYKS